MRHARRGSRWCFEDSYIAEVLDDGDVGDWDAVGSSDVVAYLRKKFFNCEEIEFVVKVDGFSDPGRTYGDPDDCYPPEGGEERDILRVVGLRDGKEVMRVMPDVIRAEAYGVWDSICDYIFSEWEPDYSMDCGPDEDDYR